MPKKRGNGEGSISQRKNGTYCAVVTTGRDKQTGKLIRRTIYGKTRPEVAKKLTEILNQINYGTYIEPSKLTVADWLDIWVRDYKKNDLKVTTYSSYESNINIHIKPHIGHILLRNLTPDHLRKFYNELLEAGRIDGNGGLSPRSVKYIHIILHSALDQAIKNQLIVRNVCDATTVARRIKKEIRVLTLEEQRKFLEAIQGDKICTPLTTDMGTGLRQGELLGLRWQDCDLKKGVIKVKQELLRIKNYDKKIPTKTILAFQEPKTEKSKRSIPLPPNILNELKEHRKKQLEQKLKLGNLYQDNDLVFPGDFGQPYDPRCFTTRFKKLVDKAKIKNVNLHSLRHTFATRLLEANIHPKVVQELLGHANISTTLDIYSHVMPEIKQAATEAINHLFKRKNPSIKEGSHN